MASDYYGVMTVGKKDSTVKVSRVSRAGDDFLRAELCDSENTFRLDLTMDGAILLRCKKRWNDAVNTPENLWDCLYVDADNE